MKTLCTALVVILVLDGISAQPWTDILSVEWQSQRPSPFKEDGRSNDKLGLEMMSADALVPVAIRNGSYLLGGGQYAHMRFRSVAIGKPDSLTVFHKLAYRAGLLYQWAGGKHKTLLLALPQWSADSPLLREEAFQMGGVVLHTLRISDDLSLKAGLYYNREFFGSFFMPLAGLDWRISERSRLYGTLPGNLHFHRMVSESVEASLSYFSPSGSMLRGDDGNYLRIGAPFPPFSILTADVHWTTMGPVVLKLSAGYTVWRHYGEYDATKARIPAGEFQDYKDGLIVKAGLILRVYEK